MRAARGDGRAQCRCGRLGGRWAKRLTILRASEAVMSAAAVSKVLTEKEGRREGESGDKQSLDWF